MKEIELDVDHSSQPAWIAFCDAQKKSDNEKNYYSQSQIDELTLLLQEAQSAYFRSKVYLNYRIDFATIKITKPNRADSISPAAVAFQNKMEKVNATKCISKTGVLYRIARKS